MTSPNPSKGSSEAGYTEPEVSRVLEDGTLIELVYDAADQSTGFVVADGDGWRMENQLRLKSGATLVPYSPRNNLIRSGAVLLPSRPVEYGTESELVASIQRFIHQLVGVSDRFERIATYYVLLSWVYDRFNELPYLRVRGDYGTGKTRFLLAVGSLCYKPIFASGASTVAPLFRALDAFRGTLIIDEADFRMSDEKAEIVKILNNGNMQGLPILRVEVSPQREFNPRAFQVFGPKLVATRSSYEDPALESRFITEDMRTQGLRPDIPISLPASTRGEALELRNKLLLYRLRNYTRVTLDPNLIDRSIEPRLSQILAPLLSVSNDEAFRRDVLELARDYDRDLRRDRGTAIEVQVLSVIRRILSTGSSGVVSIKDIADRLAEEEPLDHPFVSAKSVGVVVRRRLGLTTQKSRGVFVIPASERTRLERLFERFGVSEEAPLLSPEDHNASEVSNESVPPEA